MIKVFISRPTTNTFAPWGVGAANLLDGSRDKVLSPIDSRQIVVPSGRKMAREPIDHEEYVQIKEAIPYSDVNARLYFEILRNTGCRAAEVKRLTPAHIGQNGPEIWVEVYRGKTKDKEPLYVRAWLNPTLGQQLLGYIRSHRLNPSDLIFPRTHQRFWQIWSEASMAAIGRHSRIHDIRNVYATWMFDHGAQPAQVAAMLGHKNIKVTMAHYNQMNPDKRRSIGQNTPV